MTADRYDSARLKELDIAHHLHPVSNLKQVAANGPLVMVRGDGSTVWDSDGKEYIDAFAGLWNINVGHGRKELAEAAGSRSKKSPMDRPSLAWRRRPPSKWRRSWRKCIPVR